MAAMCGMGGQNLHFGVGHSTTFEKWCSHAGQTFKLLLGSSESTQLACHRGILTFLCLRRPYPTIINGNRPTLKRSRLGHSTFCVVRLPLFPSRGEIEPRGRCCGLGGSDVALADFQFPVSGMASEGPKTFIFLRWEATWADSEDPRGNLSIWPTWEHHFSKVVLWPTPEEGSGLPRRKLPPHVAAPTAALATRIKRFPLLHLLRRSPCSTCCNGRTAQYAPAAALATQITMLQLLHWSHGSACSTCRTDHKIQHASKCCTGHADHNAPCSFLTPVAPRVPCTFSARASPPLSPRIPSEPGAFHLRRTSSPPSRFDRAFASHSSHTA